ncbi:hypothetical protein, partial [Enterobacter intestinihominis]
PSVTAASFKYGQKYRKCSGRNVMNANGFKKFEHDSPYGRVGFPKKYPVLQPEPGFRNPYGHPYPIPKKRTNHVYLNKKKNKKGNGIKNKKWITNF